MSTLVLLALPLAYAICVGGLTLLLVMRTAKMKNYTPSMVALGRMTALGVPLLFFLNVLISRVFSNKVVYDISFGIEIVLCIALVSYYVRKMRRERENIPKK